MKDDSGEDATPLNGESAAHGECGTCRHAEMTVLPPCDHEDEGTVGYECRRFPPTIVAVSDDGSAGQAWPIVHADDWCGEWVR